MHELPAFAGVAVALPRPRRLLRALPFRHTPPPRVRICPRCVLRGGGGGGGGGAAVPGGGGGAATGGRLDASLVGSVPGAGDALSEADAARLRRVRTRVFCTMLFSYSVYYICRSTFVFAAPAMQTALGLSLTDVGIITSAFPTVYGIAKVCSVSLSNIRKVALWTALRSDFFILSAPVLALNLGE